MRFFLALLFLIGLSEAAAGELSICSFNGIDLHGTVEIVDSFPDIKVQLVDSFPDLKVEMVESFPDECGQWQVVTGSADLKIQFVDSFPDITVEIVDSFPGLP